MGFRIHPYFKNTDISEEQFNNMMLASGYSLCGYSHYFICRSQWDSIYIDLFKLDKEVFSIYALLSLDPISNKQIKEFYDIMKTYEINNGIPDTFIDTYNFISVFCKISIELSINWSIDWSIY